MEAALVPFLTARPDLEFNQFTTGDLYNNIINNCDTNGVVKPILFESSPLGEYNTQAGNGLNEPQGSAWPVDEPFPVRNVTNLFWTDDVHPNQHTNKLISNFVNQWLEPVKMKKC